MQLIQSWKMSLRLFKPSNLKLFLLVTAKSICQVYRAMICYFWPLIIMALTIHKYKLSYSASLPKWLIFFDAATEILLIFFVFVAVRSSVSRKTVLYYMRHLPYLIPFGLWASFMYGLNYVLTYHKLLTTIQVFSVLFAIVTGGLGLLALGYLLTIRNASKLIGHLPYAIVADFSRLWFIPFGSFFTLFMLDSDGRPMTIVKSLRRAMIMIYYNYPAVILLYLCSAIIYGVFLFLILLTPADSWAPWGLFLAPIPISLFANFYIKYLHAQFSFYYGEKKKA